MENILCYKFSSVGAATLLFTPEQSSDVVKTLVVLLNCRNCDYVCLLVSDLHF